VVVVMLGTMSFTMVLAAGLITGWWIPTSIVALGFVLLIHRRGFKSLDAKIGAAHVTLSAIDKAVNNTPGAPLISRVIQVEKDVAVIKKQLSTISTKFTDLNSVLEEHVINGGDEAESD
jgi:hypothetical protein